VSSDAADGDLRESAERVASSLMALGVAVEEVAVALGDTASRRVTTTLRNARAIGQFTVLSLVAQGKKMMAKVVPTDNSPTPASHFGPNALPVASVASTVVDHEVQTRNAPTCIANYETLTANQIIPLLSRLTAEELREVQSFESSGKARARVLAAIEKLL